jgi:hypothetical protein
MATILVKKGSVFVFEMVRHALVLGALVAYLRVPWADIRWLAAAGTGTVIGLALPKERTPRLDRVSSVVVVATFAFFMGE